jgi:opacity protein-like surface antigen
MRMRPVIFQAILGLIGPAALAQEQAQTPPTQSGLTNSAPPSQPPEPPDSKLDLAPVPWTISVEPSAWFVGISGRVKLPETVPASTANVTTQAVDLNLDNPRFVPFGEVNARKGDWRFTVRGFLYDAEKNASGNTGRIGDVSYASTDSLHSTINFASYEFEGAYTVAGKPLNKLEDGVYAVDTKFDIVAGMRIYDINWDVQNSTATSGPTDASFSGVFFEPVVGVKLNMDLGKYCTIDLQVAGGAMPAGSKTSYSFDIIAGFMFRPTPHVGVQIGYRSLFFGMQNGSGDGEFSFNGAVQGLYGGLDFRF